MRLHRLSDSNIFDETTVAINSPFEAKSLVPFVVSSPHNTPSESASSNITAPLGKP
jgi:hypothetical protein